MPKDNGSKRKQIVYISTFTQTSHLSEFPPHFPSSIDFRVESDQGWSDDGGGIGVRLTCEYPWSSTEYVYEYRTYSGDPAGWGSWYGMNGGSCGDSWAVGYRTNTETSSCTDCKRVN